MSKVKYILLLSALFFFPSIANAATCSFGGSNANLSMTCESSNTSGTCQIQNNSAGENNSVQFQNGASSYQSSNLANVCDSTQIYLKVKSNGIILNIIEIARNEITNTLVGETIISLPKLNSGESSTTDLSRFNGRTCNYYGGALQYNCTIDNGKPSCTISCAEGANCQDSFSFNSAIHEFTADDFLDGDSFSCPTNSSNQIELCISSHEGDKELIRSVQKECGGDHLALTLSTVANNNTPSGGNSDPSGSGTGTGTSTPANPSGGTTNDDLSLDTFCTGSVQGVFTTIGWVFFILKIAIPLLLIVFGSIDFGKAVLSSKDDEMKKSAKSLIIRVICGILIFFIPTILNFVVELIGGSEIYDENSGTFGRCTHCMLEPTDSSCSSLGGN